MQSLPMREENMRKIRSPKLKGTIPLKELRHAIKTVIEKRSLKEKDELKITKIEKLDQLGLLGSINDSDITSENYKDYLYGKKS